MVTRLVLLTTVFALVAGLERLPRLRFVPARFLRPYLATDAVWYLVATGASLAFTLIVGPMIVPFASPRLEAALSTLPVGLRVALAVVVYDTKDQRGLVKLDKFPKAIAGKDYQLWVIPTGGQPVSGGLVPVSDDGLARVSFKPAQPIQRGIDAFAISVEPSGGSQLPRGEVVFVGK